MKPTSFLTLLLIVGCNTPEAPILDRQAILDRQDWWDNRDGAWYQAHIPFLQRGRFC